MPENVIAELGAKSGSTELGGGLLAYERKHPRRKRR